ncbi:MAG: hypothetical protein JSU96_15175 [Acidobacteriota bacterium]|nr:MAG: hypothetical protein JSU96_15175 [Acidobacteriota bacterium]
MFRLLLFSLLLQAGPATPGEEVEDRLPLEETLSAKDWQKYQRETRYRNKIKIVRSGLEKKQKELDSRLGQRKLAAIYRTLAEIRGLAHHAAVLSSEESNPKELQHKEVKRLEIRLRKLSEHLEDQKLLVPYENRFHFENTTEIVEELRDQLLRQLFGQALGAPRDEERPPGSFNLAPRVGPATSTSSQRRGLWDLEKFTEEEFTEIQYKQELVKRVEAFLQIAEVRLKEIDRRRTGKEWEEEEPNPLEFFTYEDMLFGYMNAINGVMSSIDDQYESRRAEEKDVKKSLKKLKEKLEEFQPQLESLADLVREQRDEALYDQYMAALKASEVAYKGASYGLERLSD